MRRGLYVFEFGFAVLGVGAMLALGGGAAGVAVVVLVAAGATVWVGRRRN